MEQTLAERYAGPPAWRRPVTIGAVAVLALVSLGWLAWAVLAQADPKVQSSLMSYDVLGAHRTSAELDVRIRAGTTHPTCTVQALATDHAIVGELTFTPTDGVNRVTVRTDREATSVSLPGCIADGQDRPR